MSFANSAGGSTPAMLPPPGSAPGSSSSAAAAAAAGPAVADDDDEKGSNVQVMVRIRPQSVMEKDGSHPVVITAPSESVRIQ